MSLRSSIRMVGDFLFRRQHVEREMEEEFRAHITIRAEDLERQGLPRAEAERQARIEFGGYQKYKEECREALGTRLLQELVQDLRYGVRQLRRNPGFTAVAVLTLALGIGANTAIFTFVNAILLEPLPYANPSRLVYIWERWPHEPPVRAVPTPDFANWQAHNRVFRGLAAYGGDRSVDLTSNGEPEPFEGINVSSEFFSVLGVRPFLGRAFTAQEEQSGGNHAVMLGHAIWQQRFGSDRKILGRPITLNGKEYTVVGVLPGGFRFPDNLVNPQMYFPDVNATEANWHSKNLALQWVIGRLKPGVTEAQARPQLATLVQRTALQEPPEFARMRAGMQIHMIPLHTRLSEGTRPLLFVLFGAVGLVLLVACVNVACLELAHAATRRKEIALRGALGASGSRVLRQLVTESVLLSLLGATAAMAVGFWGVRLLRVLKPQAIPHIESIGMDGTVFTFTLVLAVVTGILFALVPALTASQIDLLETLKEGSTSTRGTAGWAQRPARSVLVASEIALAGVLLAGAGLLARTFINLMSVDPGCRTRHVLTLSIALPSSRYSKGAQRFAFFEQLLSRVRGLPGVHSAAAGDGIPTERFGYLLGTAVEGKPLPPRGSRPDVLFNWVSLGYFRSLGIPSIAGRTFNNLDEQRAPDVAVVNQAFVRQFFPGQSAVGKRIYTGSWRKVVGIVGNVRQNGPRHPARPEVYGPLAQDSNGEAKMVLVIHTLNDPRTLVPMIRKAVGALDKSLPIFDVATMQERLAKSISSERFNMLLVAILAALALVLVSVGIYGVTSYSVARRTHEIGIRMALGAEKRDVLKMVIGQGLKLALIGVAIGIAGALALTRFLSSMLYGVKPTDPLTFIVVSLILIGVALLACYIPARRAARVDPMEALRYE